MSRPNLVAADRRTARLNRFRPLSLQLAVSIPLVLAACCIPVWAATAPALASSSVVAALPALKSGVALVVDQDTGETLATKNADDVVPVASLTKLMTALVVLDAGQNPDEILQISSADVDRKKYSSSRLPVGTRLRREQMLLLALMSSENRASMALSRHYPGGREAFIAQMNRKARALGMSKTHFADPAGLSQHSVSTAHDLHRLVTAAHAQPLIRDYSTRHSSRVRVGRRWLTYVNSNRLVSRSGNWDIELQKTGFTNEAGRCLVMQATVNSRRLAMIFLDSTGNLTRYADATRVRRWLERQPVAVPRSGPVATKVAFGFKRPS